MDTTEGDLKAVGDSLLCARLDGLRMNELTEHFAVAWISKRSAKAEEIEDFIVAIVVTVM